MGTIEVYVVLAVLAIIGGAGLFMAPANQKQSIRVENRKKYVFFLLLIAIFVSALKLGVFATLMVYSGIILFCAYELAGVIQILYKKNEQTWAIIGVAVYAVLFPFFFWTVDIDKNLLLYLYVNVVVMDGFSQVCGQLFGKTKLVPRLSPGKTVEGLLGGASVMGFTCWYLQDLVPGQYPGIYFLFILSTAVSGDLFASWIKRKAGVKDFSSLLPGQGGFMDRYDSLIFVYGVFGFLVACFGL